MRIPIIHPEKRVPVVLISYSHDSREHKIWVLELAQKLVNRGIDVKLDQWDLNLGDDVPKFMEHWVTNAERVLMICTEPYVRKVDDGQGGAGYEAMVVTGELVKDLGTKKFIPIIRQQTDKFVLPKCIGTRLAANLSHFVTGDDEFEKLVHQLHELPPASKPPLGGVAPTSTLRLRPEIRPPEVTSSGDAKLIYDQASEVARTGDIVAWRKVVAQKKSETLKAALSWRERIDKNPPLSDDQIAREGVGN